MNSFFGFLGSMGSVEMDWQLLIPFTAVNGISNCQSISTDPILPKNPKKEFIVIIVNDVPMAIGTSIDDNRG